MRYELSSNKLKYKDNYVKSIKSHKTHTRSQSHQQSYGDNRIDTLEDELNLLSYNDNYNN